MSIKFRITKYLAVSVLAMLLLGACSKNNIYIDLADPNEENGNDHPSGNDSGNDNGNPSQKGTLVTFSASVEGRNITRAMSPMGKGLQSWLCAYLSNTSNIITGDPIAEGTYITSSPGVLAGNNGYKMYLSNNIYNFYAVSCNSKNPAPTFTNGISAPLSNGVDYLWWHATHQDVTNSQINIPITYQHAATQIVVALSGGANITLNKIISASITPPKPGAVMDLSTGIITSEKGIELSEEEATFDDGNTETMSRPAQVPEEKLDETFTSIPPSELEFVEDEPEDGTPDTPRATGSSFDEIDDAVRTAKNPEATTAERERAAKVFSDMEGTELYEKLMSGSTELNIRIKGLIEVRLKKPKKEFTVPDNIDEFNIRDYV